jgi:hypothetical protein
MQEVIEALRKDEHVVQINNTPYDVFIHREDCSSDEENNARFTAKHVYQLVLKPVVGGQSFSFYGDTKEVCYDHLLAFFTEV